MDRLARSFPPGPLDGWNTNQPEAIPLFPWKEEKKAMTFVGKILVVLILLMSVAFMGFTLAVYSTHRNWRDLVKNPTTGLETKLQNKQSELTQLESERQQVLDQLAQEKAARTEAIAALEVRRLELREQLASRESDLEKLEIRSRDAIKSLETAQGEMKRLKDEVVLLRDEITSTRRDRNSQVAAVRELTDKLNQGEGQLSRLRERNEQLVSELSRASLVIEGNGLSVNDPVDKIPPKLDGVITAVRRNTIEVSLGSDEGIRRGHIVDVFSNQGGYLGRAQVIETSTDRSVARIVPEFRQGVMRKGDRVATRLL